jgi:hypothetical protein
MKSSHVTFRECDIEMIWRKLKFGAKRNDSWLETECSFLPTPRPPLRGVTETFKLYANELLWVGDFFFFLSPPADSESNWSATPGSDHLNILGNFVFIASRWICDCIFIGIADSYDVPADWNFCLKNWQRCETELSNRHVLGKCLKLF